MINTVLGSISPDELGLTLMHEHIIWDWEGAKEGRSSIYSMDHVVDVMLSYLLSIKEYGVKTLVEATTLGAGRDVRVLEECSKRSGINIITNCGAWDGADFHGRLVPNAIINKNANEITKIWVGEYQDGIDDTKVRPGFVKLALGDEGFISDFHEKLVRAAARTSMKTGLPIQCHVCSVDSVRKIIRIIEDEGLPYAKFIWVHADIVQNPEALIQLGGKGIWLEVDCLARAKDFAYHIKLLTDLLASGLKDRILLSQDAGCFYIGKENYSDYILPYDRIFKEFIPQCLEAGMQKDVFDTIMIKNPTLALDI